MQEGLPLWPPFVALALGVAGLLYTRWEARRFDERQRRDFPEFYRRLDEDAARNARAGYDRAEPAE